MSERANFQAEARYSILASRQITHTYSRRFALSITLQWKSDNMASSVMLQNFDRLLHSACRNMYQFALLFCLVVLWPSCEYRTKVRNCQSRSDGGNWFSPG